MPSPPFTTAVPCAGTRSRGKLGPRQDTDAAADDSSCPHGRTRRETPICLFAILAGMFPRIAFAVYWIARPAAVVAAFDTFILPLLGLISCPSRR